MQREKVYDAIDAERFYQDRKWGTIDKHPHEVGGYILLMQKHLCNVNYIFLKTRLLVPPQQS